MTQTPEAGARARPVLLTVDDDPGVSRAVARDLRRHYGERFRVVRASSGEEALEALRELTLRGDRVAAVLADYRMPGMNGIEFLEQAMDLFPRARRALLTAYADTDAAIQAINLVDVDHYLLKPWEPPEEKLYPVVDAMIETWAASPDTAVEEVKLVGHHWSAPSFAARDFLARNAVPYRWYSVEDNDGRRILAAAGAGPDDVPVVVPPGGAALLAPTEAQLAAAVGLTVEPSTDFYDLVVVGGGPAGLGAAVYAASEGLRTVLVERSATGGQAGQSSRIENYLGFPDGVSGGQLADRARRQATRFGAEVLTARKVTALEVRGPARVVHFADGGSIAAHSVVLATGVAYRTLPADGADGFTGRGVYYGSALTEAAACQDQPVYVVGGANSAGQSAVFFSRHASCVTLVVRGSSLEASMSHYLVRQLADIPNVVVRTGTTVTAARGGDHLEEIELLDSAGRVETVPTSHLFVFIGAEPRTDWLDGVLARDARGFVLTGPDLLVDGERPPGWRLQRDPFFLESSVPGVFVAGDVRSQSVKRVASAVGEGAMAVTLVHRYLEER
ncbi:thioredoxin reductase (NADPH) [Geodermatophilus normandii]|uniref:Thioredoxin reductase (NADPH) n=1 Tax=Geodermatophilus normandii TaxID=1137989 RepID=A0A317QD11_9ACTN|nr:FAD-dependent oxidoreductase [Geodermatophilus normandii]PWW20933.1 thioredoxin reductase (NADPH) [Geodermatophilus normandii]